MGILFLNSYGRYLPRRRTIEAGMIGIGVLLAVLACAGPISNFLEARAVSSGVAEASRVVSLNGQLAQLTGYSNSVSDATSWANTTTGALSDMQSSVQRVRELVVEAGNGTMSAADSASAAAEVNQLIDAVKTSANATYNGSYAGPVLHVHPGELMRIRLVNHLSQPTNLRRPRRRRRRPPGDRGLG